MSVHFYLFFPVLFVYLKTPFVNNLNFLFIHTVDQSKKYDKSYLYQKAYIAYDTYFSIAVFLAMIFGYTYYYPIETNLGQPVLNLVALLCAYVQNRLLFNFVPPFKYYVIMNSFRARLAYEKKKGYKDRSGIYAKLLQTKYGFKYSYSKCYNDLRK